MNPIHKTIFLGLIVLNIIPVINAQEILTLGRAIEIAETGSPDLKRSMLNLEQFQKSYRFFLQQCIYGTYEPENSKFVRF